MDTELDSLMQMLEEAQNMDVTRKLSERTTVELISKITEKKRIDLINTRSGIREYVTWKQLQEEIVAELYSHDGRISYEELEDCLNIDITYIEQCISKLIQSGSDIMNLTKQEIINTEYTESLVMETLSLIRNKGIMKIGLIATRFNVPVSYLQSEVIPRIIKTDSTVQSKNGDLFTQDYIRRIHHRVFGIITALEKPTLLSDLCNFHSIDISLLQESLTDLLKEKQILGTIKTGSFIPQVYEDKKNNSVLNFLRDNQYITKKLLRDNRIDNPVDYFAKQKSDIEIVELDSVWISKSLISDLTDTIIEFCNEDGFVDFATILPTPFTKEDNDILFATMSKLSKELETEKQCMYLLLPRFVVQAGPLYEILEQYSKKENMIVDQCINQKKSIESILPSHEELEEMIQHQFNDMDEECVDEVITCLIEKIRCLYISFHHSKLAQLKVPVMKGEVSNRKLDQKEASSTISEFYHNYENVLKLVEVSRLLSLQEQYKQLEIQMRKEGIAYIVRLLLLLNDGNVLSIDDLKGKSLNELKEIVKELPKEVAEYVNELIMMVNPSKKKQKEVVKPKEEKVVDSKGKGKGKGKSSKKGKKGAEEEEEVEEKEEKVETYLDVFMKVTDFGGPLFKSYDRKQLRQMLHTMKMEIYQKLDNIILQSISEKEITSLASLAIINKYNTIPYVPTINIAIPIFVDFTDMIPEEKQEEYKGLIEKIKSDDDAMRKQGTFDLVPFFYKKE